MPIDLTDRLQHSIGAIHRAEDRGLLIKLVDRIADSIVGNFIERHDLFDPVIQQLELLLNAQLGRDD